jgi:hypothetical protein
MIVIKAMIVGQDSPERLSRTCAATEWRVARTSTR